MPYWHFTTTKETKMSKPNWLRVDVPEVDQVGQLISIRVVGTRKQVKAGMAAIAAVAPKETGVQMAVTLYKSRWVGPSVFRCHLQGSQLALLKVVRALLVWQLAEIESATAS